MKVGDLVRSLRDVLTIQWMDTAEEEIRGVIVEGYDTPKGLWRVYWSCVGYRCIDICHESNMEVISESR